VAPAGDSGGYGRADEVFVIPVAYRAKDDG
jgi:hypothetical protein